MSGAEVRGGIPYVKRDAAISTTGRKFRLPFYTKYLVMRVVSGASLRLYFTQENYDNDENYIEIQPPGVNQTTGEWRGPIETDDIWVRASSTTTSMELVAFQRRG